MTNKIRKPSHRLIDACETVHADIKCGNYSPAITYHKTGETVRIHRGGGDSLDGDMLMGRWENGFCYMFGPVAYDELLAEARGDLLMVPDGWSYRQQKIYEDLKKANAILKKIAYNYPQEIFGENIQLAWKIRGVSAELVKLPGMVRDHFDASPGGDDKLIAAARAGYKIEPLDN
jgi:hypothetical protein